MLQFNLVLSAEKLAKGAALEDSLLIVKLVIMDALMFACY